MKKISQDKMKLIEKELLEKLDTFCREHGLKMYLGGGTLLGAARHKGFIPWDDDIDVMMMRDDYERLLELARKKRIGKNCKLISCDDQKDYYYAFAKLVDTRTVMRENEYNKIENMGVYVDIFPIDYSKRGKDLKRLFKKKRFYVKMIFLVSGKARMAKPKNAFKKVMKFILRPIGAIMPTNYPARKINMLAKNNREEDSDVALCVSGRYNEIEAMPKEYISDSVEVEFEGRKYLAPIGYHDYLVKHYGEDYMKLPPKEKQVSNHENNCYWREG